MVNISQISGHNLVFCQCGNALIAQLIPAFPCAEEFGTIATSGRYQILIGERQWQGKVFVQ